VANQAFIDFLMVRDMRLQTTGAIRSEDYVSGVSGFRIEADGDAEFNDIDARGSILSGEIWDSNKNVVDTSKHGAALSNGIASFTRIQSYGQEMSMPYWVIDSVTQVYTAESWGNNYVRACTFGAGGLPQGVNFLATISGSSLGVYNYRLSGVTKLYTLAITPVTTPADFDIVFLDYARFAVLGNGVLYVYTYSAGTITLVHTLSSIPANARNIVVLGAVSGLTGYCLAIETSGSSGTRRVVVGVYNHIAGTWTDLSEVDASGGACFQTQSVILERLAYKYEGTSYTTLQAFLGPYLIRYDHRTGTLTATQHPTASDGIGRSYTNIGVFGKATWGGNVIFKIQDATSASSLGSAFAGVWKGDSFINAGISFGDDITSVSAVSGTRCLMLDYGRVLVIGASYGGMRVVQFSHRL